MKILWAFLLLITVSGIAQAAYINDEAFNQGNGVYLIINQTTFDNLTCCVSNTLFMNISNNAVTWTSGANRTITTPAYTGDSFEVLLTGFAGYTNFSVVMQQATTAYDMDANSTLYQARTSDSNGKVWFNYTGTYPKILTVSLHLDVPTYPDLLWWTSISATSLIVHIEATNPVEFGIYSPDITTTVWRLDGAVQGETSLNFTTSLNSLGVHTLSAYGSTLAGDTEIVTWKLLSTREKSGIGDETALLNNTWFDGVTDSMNGSSPDFTQFIGAIVAPYTTQTGALFYVFVYILPLVIIWIRQEKVLIPSGLLGIFGLALLPMLPEEWRLLAGLCVILTSFGIVYSLFKERG